ncbi:prostaglandin E synthase 3 [Lingula anatina]|uniref:Prostaglandin E synthase 3 n=1 Tax=Lingula anatina TaxID=7574 RepID=A0A1S3HY61_LINAN|nr:prostaglandin E synthase 3 [Lingula anatina]|eukprot:XP_013390948.1 prostaglandin E synthase 3 [Lingula anatina]
MAGTNGKLHPEVMWAQRDDKLFLTINLADVRKKDAKIELKEDKLIFSGNGGPEKHDYEAEIEFYAAVKPEESKYTVQARNIPMVIKKKESGPYWPRLIKNKQKVHWLKTDFAKWKDEDDSDIDDKEDMNFEEMMSQMGGFKGGSGMQDLEGMEASPENEEEDSDDEELPDLE